MAESIKTKQNFGPCTIGTVSLDLLLQEQEQLPSKVTEYPVENGSPAQDHIINESVILTITGMITNAPIRTHAGNIDSQARVTVTADDHLTGEDINFTDLAWAELRKLREARTPIAVTTKRGTWAKMLIEDIDRTKTKETGDALVFTIRLKEFRSVKLVFVAAPRKRTTSARAQPRTQAGKKETPKGPDEWGSSAYYLKRGIKTFFSKSP
jgi:hypothetical protein